MKKIRLLWAILCLTLASTTAFAETRVVLQTSAGDIEIELETQKSPITSKNFIDYVNMGFYDNLVFHRVIPDFMIQGGGADDHLKFKEPVFPPIKNEANNGLRNTRGSVSMARTNSANSATTQFFINVVNNDVLNFKSVNNYGYAVFGRVIKGMDVVDKIVSVPTKRVGPHQNVPVEPIYIKSAFIEGENLSANAVKQ